MKAQFEVGWRLLILQIGFQFEFFRHQIKSPICKGLISWRVAWSSDITMTPSFERTSKAGREDGSFIGILITINIF